ncbi:hypothetical protein [Chamaesiphon sp. VAR_48_metabat_403]|uniref:hypothetical protein n=1 Tax=Chamaesiphon sp. VAR_48_metabat_403 TaxID=2964700 RepID=UPI00286E6BAE|nr:hypothetical protein [Chamaesiphon sp. VAR_48_metabat_403]
MTTLNPALDLPQEQLCQKITRSVDRALTEHQQQLQIEREQINCLMQLLNSRKNLSLDAHCLGAIERLTTSLDRHQQSTDRVSDAIEMLAQAKDAKLLTVDDRGEIATAVKLELSQLAQRLGIERITKLSAATHNVTEWSKLMQLHPDPEGYQWQFPRSKRGFYHKTNLRIVGTKPVDLATGSSLN